MERGRQMQMMGNQGMRMQQAHNSGDYIHDRTDQILRQRIALGLTMGGAVEKKKTTAKKEVKRVPCKRKFENCMKGSTRVCRMKNSGAIALTQKQYSALSKQMQEDLDREYYNYPEGLYNTYKNDYLPPKYANQNLPQVVFDDDDEDTYIIVDSKGARKSKKSTLSKRKGLPQKRKSPKSSVQINRALKELNEKDDMFESDDEIKQLDEVFKIRSKENANKLAKKMFNPDDIDYETIGSGRPKRCPKGKKRVCVANPKKKTAKGGMNIYDYIYGSGRGKPSRCPKGKKRVCVANPKKKIVKGGCNGDLTCARCMGGGCNMCGGAGYFGGVRGKTRKCPKGMKRMCVDNPKKKTVSGKKSSRRAKMVKAYMKKHNVSLPEASRQIKEQGLYKAKKV